MSDYKERFEKWQRDAKDKFNEIDKQLGLKEKIEEGARAVVETAQKGLQEIVVPRVSQAPGFVAGYWTRSDDGSNGQRRELLLLRAFAKVK